KIDYVPEPERVDLREIGNARPDMLAGTVEQSASQTPSASHRIAAVVAEIMHAFQRDDALLVHGTRPCHLTPRRTSRCQRSASRPARSDVKLSVQRWTLSLATVSIMPSHRRRRSSSGMSRAVWIACERSSGLCGLTRTASFSCSAAPAKRDRIRTPG